MGLQSVINRLTTSLSDLQSIFKNYAYVKAFGKDIKDASGAALSAESILDKFGQTTSSMVTVFWISLNEFLNTLLNASTINPVFCI